MQHRRRLNNWRMIKRQHEQATDNKVALILGHRMNNKPIQWVLPQQLTGDHIASLEVLMGMVEESAECGLYEQYLRLYGEELPTMKANSGIEVLVNNAIIKAIAEKYMSGFVKFVYHSVYLPMPDSAFKFKRQRLIVDDWSAT